MIISHFRYYGHLLVIFICLICSQCKKASTTTDNTNKASVETRYLDDSTYKLATTRGNESIGDTIFIAGYVFYQRSDTTDYLVIRIRAADSNYTIKPGTYYTLSPTVWFDQYDTNSCLIQFRDIMNYDFDSGQSIVVSDSAGKLTIDLNNKVATSDMLKDYKRNILGKLTL